MKKEIPYKIILVDCLKKEDKDKEDDKEDKETYEKDEAKKKTKGRLSKILDGFKNIFQEGDEDDENDNF